MNDGTPVKTAIQHTATSFRCKLKVHVFPSFFLDIQHRVNKMNGIGRNAHHGVFWNMFTIV